MKYFLKRIFDIIGALFGIVVLSPIFIFISIAIRINSKGSVFFRQGRLTKGGKVFTMLKFRSMIENAEFMGTGLFNYENDFRVTKVGNFLRKTSLDELPQLFNILKGEMSFVGPRPPVTYELGNFDELSKEYKDRFRVKAGITGLAQVTGRNELPWDEKVKYDNKYIELFEKYGIFLDLKIILQTAIKVIKKEDIYEQSSEEDIKLTDEEKAKEEMRKVIEKAKKK